MTNTPFQTIWYQRSWQSNLLPPGVACEYLGLERGNDLIAVLPVMVDHRDVSLLGGVAETDYLDLIVEARFAGLAWQELLSHVFRSAHSLTVQAVPESSPTREILKQWSESHGFRHTETIAEQCPRIALPADFDTYLAGLSKHERQEIRRKLRRATDANVQLEVIRTNADLEHARQDFVALFAQQRDEQKVKWFTRERQDFFFEVMRGALDAQALCLSFARVDGIRYGTLLCFEYASTTWVYNTAVSARAPANLSIGTVLMAEQIKRSIERKFHTLDFMRGTERFKGRLGGVACPLYSIQLVRSTVS